jgi:hypothetical protein
MRVDAHTGAVVGRLDEGAASSRAAPTNRRESEPHLSMLFSFVAIVFILSFNSHDANAAQVTQMLQAARFKAFEQVLESLLLTPATQAQICDHQSPDVWTASDGALGNAALASQTAARSRDRCPGVFIEGMSPSDL